MRKRLVKGKSADELMESDRASMVGPFKLEITHFVACVPCILSAGTLRCRDTA